MRTLLTVTATSFPIPLVEIVQPEGITTGPDGKETSGASVAAVLCDSPAWTLQPEASTTVTALSMCLTTSRPAWQAKHTL
jgi:hypothetical protein